MRSMSRSRMTSSTVRGRTEFQRRAAPSRATRWRSTRFIVYLRVIARHGGCRMKCRAMAAWLLLLGAAAASAQRPDFSGTWTRADTVADRAPPPATAGDAAFRTGDMGTGWGSPLTITQRADSIIVEFPFFSAYD